MEKSSKGKEWLSIAYKFWAENKYIIYCSNCGAIFSMKEKTFDRLISGEFHLNHLSKMANCCDKPDWFFLTDLYLPTKGEPREPTKNWIQGLKEEYQALFIFEEFL